MTRRVANATCCSPVFATLPLVGSFLTVCITATEGARVVRCSVRKGGGYSGQPGWQASGTPATGGTQSAGGSAGTRGKTGATAGAQYVGGNPTGNSYGGGGGGGWYGGGGGAYDNGNAMGGGGGSGYAGAAGTTNAALLSGYGTQPPATGDPDYVAGSGTGGPVAGTGGNGLVVLAYTATGTVPATTPVEFNYTGADQTFTVPAGVSSIWVKLWGGAGGGGAAGGWSQGFPGGAGGFSSAKIPVTPGESLVVMVGQGGAYRFPNGASPNYGGGGGYASSSDNQYGASGGGRSAIRRSGADIVTAGGGGGGGSRYSSGAGGSNQGGAGGGTTGEDGYQISGTPPTGGGAMAGGAAGVGSNCTGTAGSQYTGGKPGCNSYGGGGGGGWYGGRGGGYNGGNQMGGGGGGSSYVAPAATRGVTVDGWGTVAPATEDPDYVSGVAIGAPVAGTGGNGLVVVRY